MELCAAQHAAINRRRSVARRARHCSDPAARIMARLHVSEKTRKFAISDARETLARFGHRSVWGRSSERLTIVRIDADKALSPGNAMVVDVFEARQAKHMSEDVRAAARSIAGGGNCA